MIKILAAFLLLSKLAFAHGENKAGPHGGFIRMPGAFHTELVQKSVREYRVYLLDLEFKNPSTQDSSIVATINTTSRRIDVTCTAKKYFFVCKIPKTIEQKSIKEILLNAKRQGQTGGIVSYALPLKRLTAHE